jgi:hypothetical protein
VGPYRVDHSQKGGQTLQSSKIFDGSISFRRRHKRAGRIELRDEQLYTTGDGATRRFQVIRRRFTLLWFGRRHRAAERRNGTQLARNWKFESISLQRRVHKPSVPRRRFHGLVFRVAPRRASAPARLFEGGDLSERVSHPVFGWRSSWRKDIDRDEFVRDALFFERETNCAHIDAVGRAEDDWVASSLHQMSLERWSGRPNASGLGDIRIERIRLGAADAVPFR